MKRSAASTARSKPSSVARAVVSCLFIAGLAACVSRPVASDAAGGKSPQSAVTVSQPSATAVVGAAPSSSGVGSAGSNKPSTEAECRAACDGIWAKHGLARQDSCNCRTTDGGQRCRDAAQCQGQCVAADEPEREVTAAGPPQLGYFVGHCSATKKVFGCGRFIGRGDGAPHDLSELPPKICFD